MTIFGGLSWKGLGGNAAYELTGLSLGAGLHEDSVWKVGEMLTYTIALDPHPHIAQGYSVHRPDIWK